MYTDLFWNDKTYLELIKELNPKSPINENSHCHLDPDLRESIYNRPEGWQPAFGQTGSSLTELRENGVGVGDLFLFFGWFRETMLYDGKLRFKPKAPDIHVIYGYLQIGNIITSFDAIPSWLEKHPHANYKIYKDAWFNQQNAIFVPSDRLSFALHLRGSGTFCFSPRVTLTKNGCSRSRWQFPDQMRGIKISHNPRGWKDDYFQSAARGQEFVFDCNGTVMNWVKTIFDI